MTDQETQWRAEFEQNTYWYARWTFYAAIVAAAIGVVGMIVTVVFSH